MKTQSLVLRFILTFTIGVAFIVMVTMLFSSCKNEASGTPGTLQLKATTPKLFLKSGVLASVGGATITLDAAKVEIKNLRVEENSGNDVQNQSGGQSGSTGNDGKEATEKTSTAETGSAGDLLLSGPYLLDIINGSASIDQVTVLPGTYKKVNFDFYAGNENNGHSIVISGTFTNASGATVPFTLVSDASNAIQLPLSGTGISVSSGGTATISIVFDVNNWLNKLDFNTAIQSNGQITISNTENTQLYQAFLATLAQYIDIQ